MGLHTKITDLPAAPEEQHSAESAKWVQWLGKVPLLPAVAGVGALGVVVAALSTSQVSLNFADGAAPGPTQAAPNDVATHDTQRALEGEDAVPGDSSPARASRSANRVTAAVVSFRTTSRWSGGFQGAATIANRGSKPINGWTLTFRYPGATVLSVWDVAVVRKGQTVVARNPAGAPTIAPGQTAKVSFIVRGAVIDSPTSCTLNGRACRTA